MHKDFILMKRRLLNVRILSIMRGMEARIEIMVLILLGSAMLSDLKTEKVPNGLILVGDVAGFVCRVHSPPDVLSALWDVFWPILLLYPLFLIKGLGAGDIKLFSVLSVFYHFSILTQIMILSLYVGAGIIALRLIYTRVFHTKFERYIHYTVCILAAYLIVLTQGGVL